MSMVGRVQHSWFGRLIEKLFNVGFLMIAAHASRADKVPGFPPRRRGALFTSIYSTSGERLDPER